MEENSQRLRQIEEKIPGYRKVFELAEKILEAKKQMMAELKHIPFLLEKSKGQMLWPEGFPYLKLADLPMDLAKGEEYFYQLLNIFASLNPEKYAALRKIMVEKNFAFSSFFNDLCAGLLEEERMCAEFGQEGNLLFFFMLQVLHPFLEVQAQQWEKERTKEISWPYGYCPFCGGYAGMGEIKEEGQRRLHCSLCFIEWIYPRLKCPYCQNEDQQKLSYFQVEGEVDKRVDVCLLCHHYLKTVDSRERAQPINWEVQDYLTLYLDYLAQEEGFQRPAKLFIEVK